jgi:hypothetical protein
MTDLMAAASSLDIALHTGQGLVFVVFVFVFVLVFVFVVFLVFSREDEMLPTKTSTKIISHRHDSAFRPGLQTRLEIHF